MKNSLQKVLVLLFFITIGLIPILTILAVNIPKWIFNDDFVAQESLTTILLCVVLFIMCAICMIITIKAWKNEKKYWHLQEEKAKEKLTSEFQKVNLKTSSSMKKELFECQAKIDDDGKIVCRIHLDYEEKLNNYEEFIQFFSLDDK